MAEQFNYSSVLSPYIKRMLEIRKSMGIVDSRVRWILKEFDDFANSIGLQEPHITEEFVKRWHKSRISDKEITIYGKYLVLRQLTSLMCRNGCVCYIPIIPKQPKSEFTPYIYTHDQISQLFTAADSSRLFNNCMKTAIISMPVILRLLYSTGMRVSEALYMRNEDVNLDSGYIHLRKTKNRCERLVPIGESMVIVLKQYIYVFFHKLLKICNIPYIGNRQGPRIHDLRHTFAVHSLVQMGHNGMDLYTGLPILSACLGHRSLSSTEKYVRLTCMMYPEFEKQCSPINAFVYPKITTDYDYQD